MRSSQLGRALENLAENAWTAGSDGHLVTYVPVLDSRAVDRAVAIGGGEPLFVQVKGHERPRPGDRLSFAIPRSAVGDYARWVAVLLQGDAQALHEAYAIPGPELLARGEAGHTADGRECVHATLSPDSPTFGEFAVAPAALGARLMLLAGLPEPLLAAAPERSQEEGLFFEEAVVAALYGATDRLAVYRPAVDVGRDLLVQLAGGDRYAYLQVKGTERQDRPGLARFQVRRRTFVRDPALLYLFCYRASPAAALGPLWLVGSAELAAAAAQGDAEHISFEAHIEGEDERWGRRRLLPDQLAARLLALLA
jgi:hypothetical protein